MQTKSLNDFIVLVEPKIVATEVVGRPSARLFAEHSLAVPVLEAAAAFVVLVRACEAATIRTT